MRRFTGLVNPIAGSGAAPRIWAGIARDLADVQTVRTKSGAHARAVARAAAADGRVVVAVGGDGLVRDVAGGVVEAGGVMGLVPAGRGNDLAAALGITASATLLTDGPIRPIDVIRVGDAVVPGNVYCGIDAVASGLINRTRWLPSVLAYRVLPVWAVLRWRAPLFTLDLDGQQRQVRAHTVVIGNSGRYGHGLHIVPDAVPDDAALDVLVVGESPRWEIIRFLLQARTGRHLSRPEVSVTCAREIRIAADRPIPVYGDGEHIASLPADAHLESKALSLIRP